MKKRLLTGCLCAAMLLGGAACSPAPEEEPPGEEPVSVISSSEMPLSGEHNEMNPANISDPFFTDRDDNLVYTVNALWRRFGNVSDGEEAVHLMGNEPTWYEWMTKKFLWSGEEQSKETLLNMIRNCPQSENGYIWCWGTREYWLVQHTFGEDDPEKDAVSYHYDATFRFVGAVCDVVLNAASSDFLELEDYTRVNRRDVSQKMTVREKLELAVGFILEDLGGKNGLICLPDSMDICPEMEEYVLNHGNTGKLGSNSANYWDNYCYGHYSAYENILFYQMLNKLYELEMLCGNTPKAEEYAALAKTVRQNYDKYFWDEEKGRYINVVDSENERHDYGLTFQNTEALVAGLGSEAQAEKIFSWLDGKRTVEGDTSIGADIYAYTLAPRTNTVAIESVEENDQTWWHGPASIEVKNGGNASWDKHQTNGGFIFYSEYYDMMARLQYIGPESFLRRWNAVYEEFCKDGLIRKNGWQYGITAEFPENGIVPMSFADGLLGIAATYRGLRINPVFPAAYGMMGVRNYHYGGKAYTISVEKGGTLIIDAENGMDAAFLYVPDAEKSSFSAKLYNQNGELLAEKVLTRNETNELVIEFPGFESDQTLQLVVS